jgi:hypothetical protein
MTKPRDLYLVLKKYFLTGVEEINKDSDVTEMRAKLIASAEKRDFACYIDDFDLSKINAFILDGISALQYQSIKSVKFDLSIYVRGKTRISLSNYIKSDEVEFSKTDIDWSALVEAKVICKTWLGKEKDVRKLSKIIKATEGI